MAENPVERETGIPGMSTDTELSGDSYTTRESFKAFHQSGKYIGAHEGYGANIKDKDRLFYSTREPVGVWWIKRIAYDIWDNWFRVVNPKKIDDPSLDRKVQKEMLKLKARIQLPRETVFERRYGTSIFLCSYTGFGDENDWETPLFKLNPDGSPPKRLKSGTKLLQITPYTWTEVSVFDLNEDEESIRFGQPEYYTINTGSSVSSEWDYGGGKTSQVIRVHWTRVIHDAPRLDEHTYLGVPAIDAIFDDLVGGRNARWGAYETYYRHGTGFPVIKTNATAAQNQAWVDAGGLDDYLNVKGYFICNVDEDFKFVGAEGTALNPNTYFDMYFTFISAATGVAKNSIAGVSAGRVTGGESDERQYFKAITLQQNQKEPMLRELIDRLIQTGQISEASAEYLIEWVDPFEVNPQDKAAIEFMETRTRALKTWLTINEKRDLDGLEPIDGGDELALLPGQAGLQSSNPAPNQEEPVPTKTEPEEGTPNEATLLDRAVNS